MSAPGPITDIVTLVSRTIFSALIYINAKSQKIACLHRTERDDTVLKLSGAPISTKALGGGIPTQCRPS